MKYIFIPFNYGDIEMNIRYSPEENTIWLTTDELSYIFSKHRSVISRHIKNMLDNDFLNVKSNVHILHIAPSDKPVKVYNLTFIILLSARLKSDVGLRLNSLVKNQVLSNVNIETNDDRIIIFDDGKIKLPVNYSIKDQNFWLNTNEIAELFETTRQNINHHIQNILKDKELESSSVSKDYLHTAVDGKAYSVKFYSLDMILAVGYRVQSSKAIKFRKWATEILKNVIINGYSIDSERCLVCQTSMLDLQVRLHQLEEIVKKPITYYSGDELKAFVDVRRFLETAKKEILIIDNYFGHSFDDVLSKLDVDKVIITNTKNKKIDTCDNYIVIKTNDIHDRYIIVDDICYHFGDSIEKLGTKTSTVENISDLVVISALKSLKNI